MVQARQNMLHFLIAQLMIHSFWAQENHNSRRHACVRSHESAKLIKVETVRHVCCLLYDFSLFSSHPNTSRSTKNRNGIEAE